MPFSITELAPALPSATNVRPSKCNVFVADVSGSMSWACQQLADDLITRMRRLPSGDALLLGLFSSQGWFRWPCARMLATNEDYAQAETIIRHELYARNMTCFSEIVADTPKALRPFLAQYQVVTLTFFSDGHPVTNNNAREEDALLTAALALAPLLTAGAVVAYGDYANRPLLSRLAITLGVEFVTAETVPQIGEAFSKHSGGAAKKKRKVQIPTATTLAFAMDESGTVTPLDATQVEVSVAEDATVYGANGHNGALVMGAEIAEYGAALALVQTQRSEEALQLLSSLGDVALVQQLSQALTNAELGKVEEQLRTCIRQPAARFAHGKQVGCLPKDDAFDVLDLLTLLMNDPECRFYPRHPAFTYKRIGRASKTKEGYPRFVADAGISVPLSRLVGHASELNLSIGVRIPGTVELPDMYSPPEIALHDNWLYRDKIGLPRNYDTHIFRNYALISNALLSVTQLPIRFGNVLSETFKQCEELCINEHPQEDEVCVLDLTRLPLCNRQRGRDAADWGKLADLAMESLRLGSIVKVLRHKRNELDPEREGEQPVALMPEQVTFLQACGINTRTGAYEPPTVQQDATDVLDVRHFEVKVKNGSPVSMKDFVLMVDGKKKMNFVGKLMNMGYAEMIQETRNLVKVKALAWLHSRIDELEYEKRVVDADLNARRFAVALTGAFTRAFDKDEVTVNTSAGHQVTLRFEVKQKAM